MAAPESCVPAIAGLIGFPASAAFTSLVTRTCPVSVSTSTSAPVPPIIQNGVAFAVSPVAGSGEL